jgi:hypothetical protein
MKEILETTLLEFDKSCFLIDLVKHRSGKLYVELLQTINTRNTQKQTIRINPSVFSDIIQVFQKYHAIIAVTKTYSCSHLTDLDQKKIQSNYLKGVSSKDLAMIFDQSEILIESVLRNKGIQIVPNVIPKPLYWKRKKRSF